MTVFFFFFSFSPVSLGDYGSGARPGGLHFLALFNYGRRTRLDGFSRSLETMFFAALIRIPRQFSLGVYSFFLFHCQVHDMISKNYFNLNLNEQLESNLLLVNSSKCNT